MKPEEPQEIRPSERTLIYANALRPPSGEDCYRPFPNLYKIIGDDKRAV
jgi:hypothetical protein